MTLGWQDMLILAGKGVRVVLSEREETPGSCVDCELFYRRAGTQVPGRSLLVSGTRT